MMEWVEYTAREALFDQLCADICAELRAQIAQRGAASLCVPGGSTPGPLFDRLAQSDLHWERVAVFLNDERWVDESSPRSNTALLKARLLTGRAAKATLVPLYARAEHPEECLAHLAQGLTPHLPISVLLLGMGLDMHTASLFPGADHLSAALAEDAPPLMALRAQAAGEPRITLTAPILCAARHIHLLILGPQKRAALEKATGLPACEAPVKIVLERAKTHWAE